MTPGRKFVVHKAGDATREAVLANVHATANALDGDHAWRVEFKRYAKPRSNDANEYMWVCYALIVRELGFTDELWHEEMCTRYFGKREIPRPNGSIEVKPVRTTTTDENGERDVLTGKPFWDFVEFMRRQAAEGGVYLPEPSRKEFAS